MVTKTLTFQELGERMLSPKSSNNFTRRCPESKSSFQTCASKADVFRCRPLTSFLLLFLSERISSGICTETDDGPALVSPELAIAVVSPCK
ncbi:LOW QUALITY PROTEIN: hypothetical protein PanWU01x14_236790 [Parasponia andersonii]|uniref:Uncharacterized protein n=1 Tax=Parasponia andersonii TaxID=3476 RepID=A0A2P5BI61_PARAD|nr:LOW QUALITY PROTEIN: hypothetical protein PanWU01x14_236790 [Parasponia andersonii]